MAEEIQKIPRLADKVLIECFTALARKYKVINSYMKVFGLGANNTVNFAEDPPTGIIKVLLSKDSTLIDDTSIISQDYRFISIAAEIPKRSINLASLTILFFRELIMRLCPKKIR
ncbi:MAG: hypothetical protein NTX50_01730 [Candidatus Sumerlaeota bacterium]|nr:hypothetical protein [Candidatus Sumerlaeota bacterium]